LNGITCMKVTYRITSPTDVACILRELKKIVTVKCGKTKTFSRIFLDTFDWRLYRKKLKLIMYNNMLELSHINDESCVASSQIKHIPKVIEDFPEGLLKQKCSSIIKIRALLQLAKAVFYTCHIQLLDDEKNVLAFISVDHITANTEQQTASAGSFISVQPLSDNQSLYSRVTSAIKKEGGKRINKKLYHLILESVDMVPGSYSGKIQVTLTPDMTGETACRLILLNLLDTIIRNENGIVNEIDMEFLHDFRVAVRRTRSLLSQVKGVLPREDINRFAPFFTYISKKTNEARDMDVYLLTAARYDTIVPAEFKAGLHPFLSYLQTKRKQACASLKKFICGNIYRSTLVSWKQYLSAPSEQGMKSKKADTPVITIAKTAIEKRYMRVLRMGAMIRSETPPAALHALRIECKKLRYLLEFFSSLFPRNTINMIISRMKKLQDNLGAFQDFQVQEVTLISFLTTFPSDSENQKIMEEAILYLLKHLEEKKKKARHRFSKIFKKFAEPKQHLRFLDIIW
jgi:CHAD domain-containing protein